MRDRDENTVKCRTFCGHLKVTLDALIKGIAIIKRPCYYKIISSNVIVTRRKYLQRLIELYKTSFLCFIRRHLTIFKNFYMCYSCIRHFNLLVFFRAIIKNQVLMNNIGTFIMEPIIVTILIN